MHRASLAVVSGVLALLPAPFCHPAQAAPPAPIAGQSPFLSLGSEGGATTVQFDAAAWARIAPEDGRFVAAGFPLPSGAAVDLALERFFVTTPGTRFVRGQAGGPDMPLDFDPSRIALFRGDVAGHVGSSVYLAISDLGAAGWVNLGPGAGTYAIASRGGVDAGGALFPPGRLLVSPATGGAGMGRHPDVPLCGVEDAGETPSNALPPPSPDALIGSVRGGPIRGLKHLQVAIETDYLYYALFNNADLAGAYMVQLYGAINAIYIRDVGLRLELTFVRLWDSPQGNVIAELEPFRSFWNANMQGVTRDVAQYISGRHDATAGGVAYISLCGNSAYSMNWYINGSFGSATSPHPYNSDIEVPAHELGHNCGAFHSDAYGIDNCNIVDPVVQRGTLMSYCSQTVSGGSAACDLRFHTTVQNAMRTFMATRPCVAADCNQNSIPDATDITAGTSQDANANGIPDECEDCNGNGALDSADIAGGVSFDANANGVPDECEPDCNNNDIPDALDISSGASLDRHGDGVPDECETDCDASGLSDYAQIMLDMTLDLDRNAVLDSCQDCDADGSSDLAELQGANNAWVVSTRSDVGIGEFHSRTGVRVRQAGVGAIENGQDLVVGPGRHLFVTAADTDRVLEFTREGVFVRNFVTPGSGGLNYPTGLTFGPGGKLYVSSRDTSSVLEYDGATGAFLRVFVPGGSGGLQSPFGLTFGPNGNLFVTSSTSRVLEYNGATGAFVRIFAQNANGLLNQPRGLVFKPDGHLLVASFLGDALVEYDGATGAFIRRFNIGGTPSILTLDGPWGVRVGPNGRIYASAHERYRHHVTTARLFEFDPAGGNLIRSYIVGNDSNLWSAAGFDFLPADGFDCNLNTLPDSCDLASGAAQDCNANSVPDSCDISSGVSMDADGNGVPDECESCRADFNGDGTVTIADFLAFLGAYATGDPRADFNGDLAVNVQDFLAFLGEYSAGCP